MFLSPKKYNKTATIISQGHGFSFCLQNSDIADTHLLTFEFDAIQGCLEIALLVRPRVVVEEAVDPHHVVAIGQKPVRQVRSDESGGAGDHSSQRSAFLTASGSRLGRPSPSIAAWVVRALARGPVSPAR